MDQRPPSHNSTGLPFCEGSLGSTLATDIFRVTALLVRGNGGRYPLLFETSSYTYQKEFRAVSCVRDMFAFFLLGNVSLSAY